MRVRVIKSNRPDFVGRAGTVIEASSDRGHTVKGVPVMTTYVKFDEFITSDQGHLTQYIELPTENLMEIFR